MRDQKCFLFFLGCIFLSFFSFLFYSLFLFSEDKIISTPCRYDTSDRDKVSYKAGFILRVNLN